MKKGSILAFALALTLGCTPVSAATTMAMRGKVTFPKTEITENPTWMDFNFGVSPFRSVRSKKNMKMSATFYLEKKLLAEGNVLGIGVFSNFRTADQHYTLNSPQEFFLINDGGTIKVGSYYHYNNRISKVVPVGTTCTVKERKKYYVVKLKNVPLNNFYRDQDGNKELDTKTEFIVQPQVQIHVGNNVSTIQKKVTGYVYVDDFKLVAASTVTVDFDNIKASWTGIHNAWANSDGKWINQEVVTLKY